MAKRKEGRTLGGWAFVVGLILAVVLAIFGIEQTWPAYLLIVLGLIVGILNVSGNEAISFLIAGIAFMLTFSALGDVAMGIPKIGGSLSEFFRLVNIFIAPATGIVAFRALFGLAKD